MKNFQIVMLIVFIVGAVFGVLVFSGRIDIGTSKKEQASQGSLILWGTFNKTREINEILEELTKYNGYTIKYIYKNEETFEKELLEAVSVGKGPDLFLLDNTKIFNFLNKIYNIPYTYYPLSNYKNDFTTAGDVFLSSDGIIALPILADPLMLYYNNEILNSNNIVYPPEYWDEFNNFNILTKKNNNNEIVQSSFALGQTSNISNSKEIISTLFLQSGSEIIKEGDNKRLYSTLEDFKKIDSLTNILDFYISFSNPLTNNYSWNRAMPLSIDAFTNESLVFYFGFASDLPVIFKKNPNLNFQVAKVPQIRNSNSKSTYSKVYGISVSNFSKKRDLALSASLLLSGDNFNEKLTKIINIAPARKSLIAKANKEDQYLQTFYSSSLFSKSYIIPNEKEVENIFNIMIEDILSNKNTIRDSISRASTKITNLFY